MPKARVVVLGSGFAALETAFLLRSRAPRGVDVTLVSDTDEFVFRPNTIYLPFGAQPERLHTALDRPLARRRIDFELGRVEGVDPSANEVILRGATKVPYDHLVIATGATMAPDDIPGLDEHAQTIWTPDAMLELGRRLRAVRDAAKAGQRQRVLFAVAPRNASPGPLYEIAFMVETWLKRAGVRDHVELVWTTWEPAHLQAYGQRMDAVLSGELARRDITAQTGVTLASVDAGVAHYADGFDHRFDVLVAFAPYAAAVRYDGLASDDRGFLRTDADWRLVAGTDNVYAPGDAGDFPVKQAFVALLQADAVAEHLAARLAHREASAPFEPAGMFVLEMLDTAAFAQAPFELTGDPSAPVHVRPGAGDNYRVGLSPTWRVGKKMLGVALPRRFAAGEPFHAGAGWQIMDAGLKGMAGLLAR